jgi:hypothetical protein
LPFAGALNTVDYSPKQPEVSIQIALTTFKTIRHCEGEARGNLCRQIKYIKVIAALRSQ